MGTIGIALIAKNEEDNLRRLLPQLTETKTPEGNPVFDQIVVVDTGSTDATVEVCQQYGVEVHHFDWRSDFSTARNFAFSQLTTDWLGWCDCDDQFVGLEKLPKLIDNLKETNVSALWCRYFYDRHPETGNWIAVHQRERFVKRGYGWAWTGEVHEHMKAPQGVQMAFTDDLAVEHLRDRSKDLERNERNIKILRATIKKRPDDSRLWFDLGSQYYHTLRFPRAAACYRKFCRLHNGNIEKYQALHRIGDCYRYTGNPLKAMEYERQATAIKPEWSDAWFGLAESSAQLGQWQMALNYSAIANPEVFAEHAKPLNHPDELLVLNPLDYTYHPLLVGYQALAATGRIPEAYQMVTNALQLVPNEKGLIEAKEQFEGIIREKDAVDATLALAKVVEDTEALYDGLPDKIRRHKEVRDVLVAPTVLKGTADVTIFCGPSLEDWGPYSPLEKGIGGSETAVTQLATELAVRGLKVDVYNQCGAFEGDYMGERYIDHSRFDADKPTKLYVCWRNPTTKPVKADQSWLWVHDLHYGPHLQAEHVAHFDLIRPVSKWHGEHLAYLYPFMKDRIAPTRNGINLSRFNIEGIERNPHKAIWCSSPDRGLDNLLMMWGEVRRYVPDAELHVYYGWENIDRLIAMNQDQSMMRFKRHIETLCRQPGVFWRGRLNQMELAKEMLSAGVLGQTTNFLETSFITGMECLAAGCVVQTTYGGATPETLGDAAIYVRGHPSSDAYRNVFLQNLIILMTDNEKRQEYAMRGLERAKGFSWSAVADEWVARIEGKSEVAA